MESGGHDILAGALWHRNGMILSRVIPLLSLSGAARKRSRQENDGS